MYCLTSFLFYFFYCDFKNLFLDFEPEDLENKKRTNDYSIQNVINYNTLWIYKII